MTKFATFLIFFIGFIFSTGCEKKVLLTPEEERLALIHGNLLYLYNKIKLHGKTSDSLYSIKRDSTLKKFNISKFEFENEIKIMETNPYKWKFFIAKSLEIYDELRD